MTNYSLHFSLYKTNKTIENSRLYDLIIIYMRKTFPIPTIYARDLIIFMAFRLVKIKLQNYFRDRKIKGHTLFPLKNQESFFNRKT